MLCEFCRHEFDDSLTECPYCHKKVDIEAKSLTREERDNFAGTTIEMEGTVHTKITGILQALRCTGWEEVC